MKMRIGKHKDWFNKIEKSLDMNFISIKKQEQETTLNSYFQGRYPKLFLELIHIAT